MAVVSEVNPQATPTLLIPFRAESRVESPAARCFRISTIKCTPSVKATRLNSTGSTTSLKGLSCSSKKCKIPSDQNTPRHGASETIKLLCRIDTFDEVEYFRNGGILQYVLRGMLKAA